MKVSLYKYTSWECQRRWRGGCANSSSQLCPSHSQTFPGSPGGQEAAQGWDNPGEGKICGCSAGRAASLSLLSQPGNGHQLPARFITGLPAGCFVFYNICSLFLSISKLSFSVQRGSSPCLPGAAGSSHLISSLLPCSRAGDAGFQLALRPGEQRSPLHHQQSQGTAQPWIWGQQGLAVPWNPRLCHGTHGCAEHPRSHQIRTPRSLPYPSPPSLPLSGCSQP